MPNGQITNYGFGWGVGDFHGMQFISHGGHIYGFLAQGILIPSKQLYIVILSNNTSVQNYQITLSFALRAARLTLTQPSNAHVDTKTLSEYTGVYAIHTCDIHAPQMYQYVTAKNDTLFSQYPGDFNYNLLYVSKDVFISQYRNQYYHFLRNDKNKIVSVELYDEPSNLVPPIKP